MKYKIAIVDDHTLVANALAGLIQKMDNYEVMYEAGNGKVMVQQFKQNLIPDIVLLDINMPEMDGYETVLWLKNNHPEVKVLALSMFDKEESIIGMLRNGAKGYLLKGCKPSELRMALDNIVNKGFYYTEFVTDRLIKSLNPEKIKNPIKDLGLNDRELEFINHACTELTYHQIADKMCCASRTVDGYREQVFYKMNVKSRVGIVVEAIRLGIVVL
jgi:two-component system, NarL family, invasion response regulator UvrY